MVPVGPIEKSIARLALGPAAQPKARPRPDGAIRRLQNGGGFRAGPGPSFIVDRRKFLTVVVAKIPAADEQPKTAFPGLGQAPDFLALTLRQGDVEKLVLQPVKSDQSFLRSEPEITVLGLGDAGDEIGRETVLAGPVLAIILINRFCRIQGHRREGRQQDSKDRRNPSPQEKNAIHQTSLIPSIDIVRIRAGIKAFVDRPARGSWPPLPGAKQGQNRISGTFVPGPGRRNKARQTNALTV